MRVAVLDVRNDSPVAHARLDIDGNKPGTETDDDGAYRWPHAAIPAQGTLRIACPRRHQLDYRTAIIGRWPYSLPGCLDVVARVDLSRCSEQVEHVQSIRLRGMYVLGFEESAFYPCDGMPTDASEFIGAPHMIWVESVDMDMPSVALATLKRVVEGRKEDSALFVDWSGSLRGPGYYGHMGLGLYGFSATEVHRTGLVKPADCTAPGYAERMAKGR